MMVVRRLLYIVNILTIIYIILALVFSANSIRINYAGLVQAGQKAEKEYAEILDKYKEVAVFVLKNQLPVNISYFNLVASNTYNLPPVKEFVISKLGTVENQSINGNSDEPGIINCYHNKCIKLAVEGEKILNKIAKSDIWRYKVITSLPLKKATLFKISAELFLDAYKKSIIITLLYFVVLYLSQAIFFFLKNHSLSKELGESVIMSHKNKQDLKCKVNELNKLHDSLLSTYELLNEYFTYYVYQLVAQDVYLEKINIKDTIRRIEQFFGYQIVTKNLKITIDNDSIEHINSSNEILFIVLLNLIFKSLSRAKIYSEIDIKIFQLQDIVNIEIKDRGYEYQVERNDKIQLYLLPDAILEILCRKAQVIAIKYDRKDEINVIYVQIKSHAIDNADIVDKDADDNNGNNTIKIKLGSL